MEDNKSRDIEIVTVKKTDSLLFKFGVVFSVFTAVVLILSGVATYRLQNRIYEQQIRDNVRNIAEYLQSLIKTDDMDFYEYQKYLIEHRDEIFIPADFDGDYIPAMDQFLTLLSSRYPGKTLFVDISFDELDDDIKRAFVVYTHEYWLNVFESAARTFDVEYTYYIVPTGEPDHMYYVIDALRDIREVDGKSYINLCLDIHEDSAKYPVMWKTLESGRTLDDHDIFNNEYGYNYAFYSPLFINGEELGLIAVDVAVDKVNSEILRNTLLLVLTLGVILITGVIVTLIYLDRKHIAKIEKLVSSIKQYTVSKDPKVADFIKCEVTGRDEVGVLASQTVTMITELDQYMKNLTNTTRELTETKQHAHALQALSNRDALTGIRNKTAYDEEIKRLEWDVAEGNNRFGFAMIDLNFLKRFNERYGHEMGNIAIRKLCTLVCSIFKHSPVFRIGGDEFVVILRNADYDDIDKLTERFNKEIERLSNDESLEPWERISASIGVALFDPAQDFKVDDVFRRADANMYLRKQEMKEKSKEIE